MKRGGTLLLTFPPLLTNLLHHEKNEISYVLTFFRKKTFIGQKANDLRENVLYQWLHGYIHYLTYYPT